MLLESIFHEYLLELLLTIILTFNVGAYKLLLDKSRELEDEVEKNSESVDVILNRIFGIEQDPTDEGHIMETEQRFEELGETLEKISKKQDQNMRERKEEHKRVDRKISSIIQVLAEEERVDIEREDFEEES